MTHPIVSAEAERLIEDLYIRSGERGEALLSFIGALEADAKRWRYFMNHWQFWGAHYHRDDDDWELLSPAETQDKIDAELSQDTE